MDFWVYLLEEPLGSGFGLQGLTFQRWVRSLGLVNLRVEEPSDLGFDLVI